MKFIRIKREFLFFLLLIPFTLQYSIILKHGSHECFYEELKKDEKLVISYQTSSMDDTDQALYISFVIWDPKEKTLEEIRDLPFKEYSLKAKEDGKYKYCFSNEILSGIDIELFFNIHHLKNKRNIKNAADFNNEIAFLNGILMDVRDEQEYLKVREKTHRVIAENTNLRVQNWNIFQIIVLISLILFHIYFLKRFFEVKRII